MNIKKFLPHLVAIAIFAIITLVQFSPLFSGKSLMQGDIVRFRGMSHELGEVRQAEHSEALW
ncbi:UNVERIFIED_CONTAM: hypothetical protein IGO34_32230, partial [Salmonella enterica subsp. enterica serovar Weltevreden]